MTRAAQVLFALAAVAALAALLANQRLKGAPTYIHRVKVDESITPNGDGRRDVGTVQIVLGEPDDVSMAVLDAGGAVVRDLGTRRDRPARERILFRWDGRTDAGAVGPEGRYRFRVSLARRGQAIVLQRSMRVRRVPPRPAAGAPAAGSRPRGPGAARAPARRSSASTSAVGPAVEKVALVVLAALAGAVLVLRRRRPREAAMAAALGAAPALVLAHLWNGEPLAPLREHAVAALAAGAALLAALGAGAAVLLRRPQTPLARLLRRPETFALAAVAVMPFRVPVPVGGGTVSLLLPLYAVIAGGVLAAVLRRREGPEPVARPGRAAVGWALAGFLGLYALQAAYAGDVEPALEQVAFFYVPFAVLFALLARVPWSPRLLARCGAVLAGLALALCVVGFVQYATGTLLLNERLMRSNAYTPYFRVNALFLDPNIFGRFLAVVAVGVAAVAAWSRDRRAILAAGAVLAVLLAGLLTTRSQSSLLALLVGLGVLAALRGRARTVLAVAGVAGVAGALLVAASPGVLDLASDDAASVRKATSGRSDLLGGGAELFAERPFAGWGSGSFVQVYRREIRGGRYDVVSASHTIPMTVAVEQGLVGLVAYLALLGAAFRMLLRRARDSLPRAAVAAAFAALVVHTLLYASFLEDPLAWALLGVGAALGARPAAPAEPPVGRDAAPVPARAG